MLSLKTLLTTLVFSASACAAPSTDLSKRTARTSPPSSSCKVVSKTPASGQYSTVSAAVAALGSSSSSACIFINPGTYSEQVYITYAGSLTIYGYTSDTSSYSSNQVTITASATSTSAGSDDASGTLRVHKNNFAIYNVNIVNSEGTSASHTQAIAVSAYGSQQGYYACQIIGYQDTLLAETGTQYYGDSYIQGAVDFIFGQDAQAYFKRCYIASSGPGTITASGRDSASSASAYVFDSCYTVLSSGAASGTSGNVYLGRPWYPYARVVFKYSSIGSHINPAGWEEWSASSPNTADILFGEYENTGPESSTANRQYTTVLTATTVLPFTISATLGSDYTSWVDSNYS